MRRPNASTSSSNNIVVVVLGFLELLQLLVDQMTTQFTKLFSFILANVHDPAPQFDAGELWWLFLDHRR